MKNIQNEPTLINRLLVWGLAFLIFAAFTPRILDFLRPPTGDEVFYLITTQSLLYDRDTDETNQFEGRSWLEFYPTCAEYGSPDWKGFHPPGDPCSPGSVIKPEATTALHSGTYTKHGLGLSFLIIPAYALGGRFGVMLLLNGLAALVVLNIFLLAWEKTRQMKIALFCAFVMGFSAPVLSYAYLIFPQLTAALCILYAYRRLRLQALYRQERVKRQANTPFQLGLTAICLGFLPWLHSLYMIFLVILGAYFFLGGQSAGELKQTYKKIISNFKMIKKPSPVEVFKANGFNLGQAIFLVFLGVPLGLFLVYYTWLYGVPLPKVQDHNGFSEPWFIPQGFLGLLLDQKYGLLMFNPLYLVPIAWTVKAWLSRKKLSVSDRNELIWLIIIIFPYYLVLSDYTRWWGQWCPPARYLLPVVPLLAGPLAQALAAAQNRFFKWFVGVSITWAGVITVAFLLDPRLSYHWEDTNPSKILLWLENNPGFLKEVGLRYYLPGYVNFIEPVTPLYWVAHIVWPPLALWLGWRLFKGYSPTGGKV